MPISTLRRGLVALAMVAPLTAAHPAERTLPAAPASGFETAFEGSRQLPASAPAGADGAVDLAVIDHTQPGPGDGASADAGAGTAMRGGMASYYGRQFEGRRTASGERFAMAELTAAHRTLPFGSKVRVTNPANGRSVVVRINDRGPFHGNRVIDVSHAAAQRLGLIAPGSGRVSLTLLD